MADSNQRKNKMKKHAENKWIILTLLAMAQFMVVLDVTVVNVALPSIARQLHFSANNLQWVITAYTLTFGGFLLLGGRAADLYGRRKIFIGAVTAFATMSLLTGLAQTETWIIISRALQGLAGAIMSPAALSIVISEFKEGKERNAALGVWSAVAAGGSAVGVLLGGVLTQYLTWRWNFFINVPVGILVVLLAFQLLPKHIGEENKKIKLDLPGAAMATAGLMTLVFGLSKAPNDGWTSPTVISFLAIGIVLLIIFVINELKTPQPLMSMSIFRIRNVAGGNLTFLAIACTLFAMFFFLTLYVQTVLGYGPAKSGLAFLPATFVIGFAAAIVSRLVSKIGYKPFIVAGPLVMSFGLYIMAHTMKIDGRYWQNVFPGLAIVALGMGLSFVSGTLAATSGIPKHFSGLASGVLNTSQQVGGAIGLGILSAVFASRFKTHIKAGTYHTLAQVQGYQAALHVGVGLALAAAVIAFLLIKNQKISHEAMVPQAAA